MGKFCLSPGGEGVHTLLSQSSGFSFQCLVCVCEDLERVAPGHGQRPPDFKTALVSSPTNLHPGWGVARSTPSVVFMAHPQPWGLSFSGAQQIRGERVPCPPSPRGADSQPPSGRGRVRGWDPERGGLRTGNRQGSQQMSRAHLEESGLRSPRCSWALSPCFPPPYIHTCRHA